MGAPCSGDIAEERAVSHHGIIFLLLFPGSANIVHVFVPHVDRFPECADCGRECALCPVDIGNDRCPRAASREVPARLLEKD